MSHWLIHPVKAFLRGVEKHHEVINIFLVVIVAIASIVFALNTQRISNSQNDILKRQLELESAQQLPVFRVSIRDERDSNGTLVTQKLLLTNQGGLVRNADVFFRTWVQFGWEPNGPKRFAVLGAGVPLPGFYPPEGSDWIFNGREAVYGIENNMRDYQNYAARIKQRLEQQYGTGKVRYYLDVLMHVGYTDYMGNERSEFYLVIIQKNYQGKITRVDLSPVATMEGERLISQFSEDIFDGISIRLWLKEDDE